MCWYTENHKHNKTLDPALQDAYWHGQCHRDKCSWQRRAHSQESRQRCVEQRTAKGQEERLCRCERECFFFKSCQYISQGRMGRSTPSHCQCIQPVLRLTLMKESEENLGNTCCLRPELNAVINNVLHAEGHPNHLSLGR